MYAMRTLAALLERECHLEVVISDYGRRLLHDELGERAAVTRLREYLVETYGEGAAKGSFEIYPDLGSKLVALGQGVLPGVARWVCDSAQKKAATVS